MVGRTILEMGVVALDSSSCVWPHDKNVEIVLGLKWSLLSLSPPKEYFAYYYQSRKTLLWL
jgi:hypothetical protein